MNSAARKSKKCRKASPRMETWKEQMLDDILEDEKRNMESQPPPTPPEPEISRPSDAIKNYDEWPKEVFTDPVKKNWYRGIWAMMGLVFLLALIPTAISALFGLIPREWPYRSITFATLHALSCGYHAPGLFGFLTSLFTVIGMSLQKGEIRLPNQAGIFRESGLTPMKKRSLWGYISILVYFAFPKQFYVKVFHQNYKQLLEDLNSRHFLTNQEIGILMKMDTELHKEEVLGWIYSVIGDNGPTKNAFLKFQDELTRFKLKFFTPDEVNRGILIPIAKCILVLMSICSLSDFTESGVTSIIIREFPVANILGLFFSFVSFYCGLYTVDVYDVNTHFFNGIKKSCFHIKKHRESVEKKIIQKYCQVDDKVILLADVPQAVAQSETNNKC
jgi:hypothetical protein